LKNEAENACLLETQIDEFLLLDVQVEVMEKHFVIQLSQKR
jgi:hypothetical protein